MKARMNAIEERFSSAGASSIASPVSSLASMPTLSPSAPTETPQTKKKKKVYPITDLVHRKLANLEEFHEFERAMEEKDDDYIKRMGEQLVQIVNGHDAISLVRNTYRHVADVQCRAFINKTGLHGKGRLENSALFAVLAATARVLYKATDRELYDQLLNCMGNTAGELKRLAASEEKKKETGQKKKETGQSRKSNLASKFSNCDVSRPSSSAVQRSDSCESGDLPPEPLSPVAATSAVTQAVHNVMRSAAEVSSGRKSVDRSSDSD